MFKKFFSSIDPVIFFALVPLILMSLSSLYSFSGEGSTFFERQVFWFLVSFVIFILLSRMDFSFLRKTRNVFMLYGISIFFLVLVLLIGSKVNGARSWIRLADFSFQPADFVKFSLVILLAKYLEKRHRIIKSLRELFFTFLYFFIPFLLIFLQPDLGSDIIVLSIWFGIVMLSGLSKKHFFSLLFIAMIAFAGLWSFVLHDYQKARIRTFLHPLSDVRASGYNAYQSVIAVGSGGVFGKGIGYGTQSRLAFLPEYETDFIFASIAEEWGFIGVILLLLSFAVIFMRLFSYVKIFPTNFERLVTLGFIIYLFSHFVVHVGMNIGLLPVTGLPLPFVSYGGSHLIIEFLFLALIMSFWARRRGGVHLPYKEELADAFLR